MTYPVIDLEATGNRIRELREELNISAQEIADFMGFTATQAVYKWEEGKSMPTSDNLYALCKILGTYNLLDIMVEQQITPKERIHESDMQETVEGR